MPETIIGWLGGAQRTMTERSYRRIVSATSPEGVQAFVLDELVGPTRFEGSHPESAMYKMWGLDARPALPSDASHFDYGTAVPPPGGFRAEVMRVPPAAEAAEYETRSIGAGFLHQTPSVDLICILEGEMTVELGDGEQRVLRAGDLYVNYGTNHTWHNHSDQVCTAVGVMIGAEHPDGPEWLKV